MRISVLAACAVAVASMAGCSAGRTPALPAATPSPSTSAAPTSSASPLPGCNDDNQTRVESYAPAGSLPAPTDLPANSTMAVIRKRGRLIAAVSADNLLFGFRDPVRNQLEGFDIDMIRAVARAIFGDVGDIDAKIEYRVVNFAQRIPALQSKQVDIVADIMTINCRRWSQLAFSSVYYQASQQVLVPKGSGLNIDKLAGKQVCSAKGSTGSQNLKKYPKIKAVLVENISDCMVLFQQGSVAGVISDNTVVAGFASQDRYAEVSPRILTNEPYGMGFNKKDIDFTRFVNALLAQMRADGSWVKIYDTWLRPTLGPISGPPPAVYGRLPA